MNKLDFVGVPSTDSDRTRTFYVETLGLRTDDDASHEFHVDDVAASRAELEAKGVEFFGEIIDTGVCHMALFTDPDGNDLMLHHRYAPRD